MKKGNETPALQVFSASIPAPSPFKDINFSNLTVKELVKQSLHLTEI